MAEFGTGRPVWGGHFTIDGGERDGFIRLAQRGRSTFALESVIEYDGPTGLDHLDLDDAVERRLRRLEPHEVRETDLASIPTPMRWWVNTYGVHTPAALIHDHFIGGDLPDGVSEEHIDRYFRFMLADVGVRIGKRWLMWSAVALRTRFMAGGARRWSVVVWAMIALTCMAASVAAAISGSWGLLAFLAGPAPLLAATLWWRQFGAALIAAYVVAPLLVVPMLVSVTLLLPFWLAERIASWVLQPDVAGTEPIWVAPRSDRT